MAYKNLKCFNCRVAVRVDKETKAVLCADCTNRIAGVPESLLPPAPKLTKSGKPRKKRGTAVKKVPSGKPRGWHFKICYVHKDGTVWSRGELVTDPKVAKKLKKENA